MNLKQRIVLIIGAMLLLIAVGTSPRYQYDVRIGRLRADTRGGLANTIDWTEALVRGLAVFGATGLAFVAFKSREDD